MALLYPEKVRIVEYMRLEAREINSAMGRSRVIREEPREYGKKTE